MEDSVQTRELWTCAGGMVNPTLTLSLLICWSREDSISLTLLTKLSWSFFSVDTAERGSPVTRSYSTSSTHTCRPHSYQSQRVAGSSHEVNVVLQSLGTCRDVLRVRVIVGSVCGCVCACVCVCVGGEEGGRGWVENE